MADYLWINYIEFVVHVKAGSITNNCADLVMQHKSS
jgi:hypothetical protein